MQSTNDFERRLETAFHAFADGAPLSVDVGRSSSFVADRPSLPWRSPRWSPATWIAVALLLALVLASVALVGSRGQPTRPLEPVSLDGGGHIVIAQLQLSGDGFSNATGMHVFAFDLATGQPAPIVDVPSADDSSYGPATWANWSPDRVHLLLYNVGGEPRGIVDVANHGVTPLRTLPGGGFANGDDQSAWAPSSDRVVIEGSDSANGDAKLLIYDLGGVQRASVPLPRGADVNRPDWSPDGSTILVSGCLPCARGVKGGPVFADGHLLLVPIDGSPVRVLLDPPVASMDRAVWSRDGSRIAFTASDGLTVIDVATGKRAGLAVGQGHGPTWSPDGRRIAFVHVDAATGSTDGIFVVNVDGSGITRLTDDPNDVAPHWSPDGSAVLFGRQTDIYADVWVVRATGGAARFLFKNATADW